MHPKQSERSQRISTQFKNKLHGTHKEYWYPIPIHFCQHLLNLDCDGYEFCHQTEKVVCNTCTVRMQGYRGCRLHGAVPYAKCWISLATTVHRCTHVQSLTHAHMTKNHNCCQSHSSKVLISLLCGCSYHRVIPTVHNTKIVQLAVLFPFSAATVDFHGITWLGAMDYSGKQGAGTTRELYPNQACKQNTSSIR